MKCTEVLLTIVDFDCIIKPTTEGATLRQNNRLSAEYIFSEELFMKSLKAIQVLSRIGKILSTIVYICCMIGAITCAVCVGLFALYGEKAIQQTKENAIQLSDKSVIETIEKIDLPYIITAMVIGAVFCAASAVVAKFAQNYFKHELEDGTPFTMRGAKELMRLGIIYIAVNLGASIVCGAAYAIASKSIESLNEFDFEGMSIGLGITFIVVSVILRYGAELTEAAPAVASAPVEAAPAAEEAPVEAAPAAEETPAEV